MLEWLTRDPLNGLVITIAFFISLILGRGLKSHVVPRLEAGIRLL